VSEQEFKVKKVLNKSQAIKVWEMFLIPNIIGPLSDGEKKKFKENILLTLNNPKGAFFYLEKEGKVIGAIGAWENYIANGGFMIENFAVVPAFRGAGAGRVLFSAAEDFVLSKNPRYIIIETGDEDFYEVGRKMYEKRGYVKAGHFPEYFCSTSGRVVYIKNFKQK
jgi:GNAT superfamily N-acetyltransferase